MPCALFQDVVAKNAAHFAGAAVVRSPNGVRPVKGWSHREVDQLLTAAERLEPGATLANIGSLTPSRKYDLDQLKLDVDAIKKARPDLFTVPAGARGVTQGTQQSN